MAPLDYFPPLTLHVALEIVDRNGYDLNFYNHFQTCLCLNKLASLKATLVETTTDLLTGVECRATSVAKNWAP